MNLTMLTYNTRLRPLKLPEYGRNIQQMVDFCLTIEDREERTACAFSIIRTMETLFPYQGDKAEYRKKLWDHLALMSDFNLDVDAPYPLVRPEELDTPPEKIDRPARTHSAARRYGTLIPKMVDHICSLPENDERHELTLLVANQMKKLLLNINRDGVEDTVIFNDLFQMSKGAIRLDPEDVKLRLYQAAPVVAGKKKKKK